MITKVRRSIAMKHTQRKIEGINKGQMNKVLAWKEYRMCEGQKQTRLRYASLS